MHWIDAKIRYGAKFVVAGLFVIDFGKLANVLRLKIFSWFRQQILVLFHQGRVLANSDQSGLESKVIIFGLLFPHIFNNDAFFFLEVKAFKSFHLIAPKANFDAFESIS